MRHATWIPIAVVSLAMMSAAAPEPVDHACACHPREVGASGSRVDWKPYREGGLAWHYSIDEALTIARKERRLVFWYHVAGDLDKEGC